MSWQPDPTSLNQLIDLLKNAQSPDSNVQKMVYNVNIKQIILYIHFFFHYNYINVKRKEEIIII